MGLGLQLTQFLGRALLLLQAFGMNAAATFFKLTKVSRSVGLCRQFLDRALRIRQTMGPNAAATVIKLISHSRYVRLGLVKTISGPNTAAI